MSVIMLIPAGFLVNKEAILERGSNNRREILQLLQRILEDNSVINWRGKYILTFIENMTNNPLQEWSGYVIDIIDDASSYQTIYKSQSIKSALERFIELIEKEV